MTLCSTRSGSLMLKELLDGSSGPALVRQGGAALFSAFIDRVCSAVPALHTIARATEDSAEEHNTPPRRLQVPSTDDVQQTDLWAMLSAITRQADVAQRQRIHGHIGNFVSAVSTEAASAVVAS